MDFQAGLALNLMERCLEIQDLFVIPLSLTELFNGLKIGIEDAIKEIVMH